jgi:hypothetical protein
MTYNNLPRLLFVSAIAAIFALTSCQREVNFTDTLPVTEYVKDSTLLIKSITLVSDDALGVQDSITENYSYDSVNRKIRLTWHDPSGSDYYPDGTIADFSYNDKWLLSHVDYIYPAGYVADAFDYSTFDILYDAQKVLQKITTKYGDGSDETKTYTKTTLASGNYQLSWDESDPATPGYKSLRRAVFNADGKNSINVFDRSFVAEISPAGDDVFTNFITSDTLFYDASGSVSKIKRNEVDTLRHTDQTFLFYEFTGRQTRGDQLYNQRQGILNGIANMPFGDGDSPADAFGVLSIVLDFEPLQYSIYPVQTTKIYNWNMTDFTFNSSSEFDSKNRLVKFKGFFIDLGLTNRVFKIKYFK